MSSRSFSELVPDIIRFILHHFRSHDIVRLSRTNKEIYSIANNKIFLRDLVKKYLTEHEDRFPPLKIVLQRIHQSYIDIDININQFIIVNALNGYEKALSKITINPGYPKYLLDDALEN